jgi:putative membrane protein
VESWSHQTYRPEDLPALLYEPGDRLLVYTDDDMRFLIRYVTNAAALWVATVIVPGVTYSGEWLPFLAAALVFAVINATLGPLTKVLTCPLILLTLGLFALVVNGLMLWLTSAVSESLGLGFHVTGFWAAFFGGLVVSIVSGLASLALRPPKVRIDMA